MFKKETILITLMIILAVVAVYLIIASRPVEKVDNISSNIEPLDRANQVNQEELENNYQQEVKKILAGYFELMSRSELSAQNIELIKGKLLELKVPTSLKDLHLSLVLATLKMENYFQEGNEADKLESERLVNQAKDNYVWLSN